MMSKKKEWIIKVSPELEKNLIASATEVYCNGCDLYDDALALYEIGRYSRSTALAILAEEEFSKALLLSACAAEKRWDSNIYKVLREHNIKQAFAEALRNRVEWLKVACHTSISAGESVDKQRALAENPPDYVKAEMKEKFEKICKKPVNDYLKQDSLYVSINENGSVKSAPKSISEIQAKNVISETLKAKDAVEILLNGRNKTNIE